jgi:hypothetical protein
MLSVASTDTLLRTPEMVRLAQWPVITTSLATPLMLRLLSRHATVRISLIPATLRLPPTGAVVTDVDGAVPDVCGIVPDGAGLGEEKLGKGNMVGRPLRDTWCALKKKIARGRQIIPITKTASIIQRIWLRGAMPVRGLENESL